MTEAGATSHSNSHCQTCFYLPRYHFIFIICTNNSIRSKRVRVSYENKKKIVRRFQQIIMHERSYRNENIFISVEMRINKIKRKKLF